jgi:hypothetical protein
MFLRVLSGPTALMPGIHSETSPFSKVDVHVTAARAVPGATVKAKTTAPDSKLKCRKAIEMECPHVP